MSIDSVDSPISAEAFLQLARMGDIEGVRTALAAGADPNAMPGGHKSALMMALMMGNRELAVLLLPVSDPLIASASGHTALLCAASSSLGALRLLIPVSDPLRATESGLTALMAAARLGKADNVSALLPVSDPHALDENGMSALGHARSFEAGGPAAQVIEAWLEARALERELPAPASRPAGFL